MGEKISSFDKLILYRKAFEFQQRIFETTKKFPKDELFSLTNQIRRSSRSIGANIAEAWQKRKYPAHFVSKLTDADAEQSETLHWLYTSLKCEYIGKEEFKELKNMCDEVGRMTGSMILNPEKWCPNSYSEKQDIP